MTDDRRGKHIIMRQHTELVWKGGIIEKREGLVRRESDKSLKVPFTGDPLRSQRRWLILCGDGG